MTAVAAANQSIVRNQAMPILRWVGGKRDIAPMVAATAYTYLSETGGRYIEPFLGGGAVALELGIPNMLLSDLCAPLINTYEMVRKYPRDVFWMLDILRNRGTDAETYYAIREEQRPQSRIYGAARFLYLNTLCFNGVYRENSKGEYNVPYGVRTPKSDKKLPGKTGFEGHSFRSMDDLLALSRSFATAELCVADFRVSIKRARKSDFVFSDSPYYGTFDKYLKGGFDEQAHVDLAELLREAYDRGAEILVTYNDHPRVRELYDWAAVVPYGEFRRVNRNAKARGKVDCVILTTVPERVSLNE